MMNGTLTRLLADVLVVCVKDVVNALEYLHKRDIAHRDGGGGGGGGKSPQL